MQKTDSNKIHLALIQSLDQGSSEKNLQHFEQKLSEAVAQGANMICSQELFLNAYFCQEQNSDNFDLAVSIPGKETEQISKLAQKYSVVIVASLFEKRAPGLYHNTAVVFDTDGKFLGSYRKLHIPDDPYFMEKYYFAPGDLGVPVFETSLGKVAVLICWDQWFPELARIAALKGAELIVYPTAIGWIQEDSDELYQTQLESWKNIQISHAIANACYVASVNRVGQESGVQFWGNSFVVNPRGQVISEASQNVEEVLVTTCDLNIIEEQRRDWPFLRDRRVDQYSDLLKIYGDSGD